MRKLRDEFSDIAVPLELNLQHSKVTILWVVTRSLFNDSGCRVVESRKDQLLAYLVAVFGLIEGTALEFGPNSQLLFLAVAFHHGQGQVFGWLWLVLLQQQAIKILNIVRFHDKLLLPICRGLSLTLDQWGASPGTRNIPEISHRRRIIPAFTELDKLGILTESILGRSSPAGLDCDLSIPISRGII